MNMDALPKEFERNIETQKQAIFTSIFVIQNRLQTVCDDLDTEITIKQWLLLAITTSFSSPPTLTALGKLMGCSRQNAKKLAAALEDKGFLRIQQSEAKASAASVVLEAKAQEYGESAKELHRDVLELLFQDFGDEELARFFGGIKKLYTGIERIEKLAEGRKGA